MDAEGRVHIPKISLPDKAALRAAVFAALLAGGAVNADFSAGLVDHLLQGGAGEDGGRAEKIMAAAVAETGQGVILREKGQDRAGLSGLIHAGEAGRVAGDIHGDGEALRSQLIREQAAGENLMIARFRMGVNVQGQLTVERILPVRVSEDSFPKRHRSFFLSFK